MCPFSKVPHPNGSHPFNSHHRATCRTALHAIWALNYANRDHAQWETAAQGHFTQSSSPNRPTHANETQDTIEGLFGDGKSRCGCLLHTVSGKSPGTHRGKYTAVRNPQGIICTKAHLHIPHVFNIGPHAHNKTLLYGWQNLRWWWVRHWSTSNLSTVANYKSKIRQRTDRESKQATAWNPILQRLSRVQG